MPQPLRRARSGAAHLRRALALLAEAGDRSEEAGVWDSLGHAHHHLGDHGRAIGCYQRALALFRELGNRSAEAATLLNLGDASEAGGDPERARASREAARSILDKLGGPHPSR